MSPDGGERVDVEHDLGHVLHVDGGHVRDVAAADAVEHAAAVEAAGGPRGAQQPDHGAVRGHVGRRDLAELELPGPMRGEHAVT